MPTSDIKKFLPERLLEVIGENLPAIIGATNEGIDSIEQTVQACIDQLYLATASGRYLINLGEQDGFTVPPSAGLDIRAFRVLVPLMVSAPKQVRITINDLIRAFYGSERTKPNISATIFGPYSITSGDDIIVETESGTINISVLDGQVSNLSNVSALELSAVINYSQDLVLADTVTDRSTGQSALRLMSKTDGTGAYIKVSGGKLQNLLLFPKFVNTNITAGINWNITKTSALNDELKFTWDNVGTNPNIYLANIEDYVIIRDLADGAYPYSKLNGSYQLLDVGYDYFVIRNSQYTNITSNLVQPANNNIVFSKNETSTIFDLSEYGFSSEVENQTITITIPAVPPLTLRFLQGSTHLHGIETPVLDFTRNTMQIALSNGTDKPVDLNQFLIKNPYFRYDFNQQWYTTFLSNTNITNPTYQVDQNNTDFEVFPYTVVTPIGGTINGEVDSDEYTLTFPNYKHGLKNYWGFTLSSGTSFGNISSPDLNKEHQVLSRISDKEVRFKIRDSSGTPVVFEGSPFGPLDIYRQPIPQSDGSDAYIQYASAGDLIADNWVVGQTFKLDPLAGLDIDPASASQLKYRKMSVTSIVNNGTTHQVNFASGIGPGGTGMIISGAEGSKSSSFGGSSLSYYLDKTSNLNQERVLNGLKALFISYTPASNPAFVGSYIYDPQGEKTQVTVSKFVANLEEGLLKGETVPAVFVDSLNVGAEQFPDSGKIIIGYGTDKYEGPIRYYSTSNTNGLDQVLIDPAYKFKFTHDIGEKIQFIHDVVPFTPDKFGAAYPAYITGTTEARNSLINFIKSLVAVGVFVEQSIIFPDLTYVDISLPPFE